MTYLIRQMGHVALGVPDPEASARDLQEIVGLKITGRKDGAVFLSSNSRKYEISFAKSPRPRVLAIGLEAESPAAIDEIHKRAKSDGLKIISDKPLYAGIDRALRFCGPSGEIYEVHTPVARSEAISHNGPGSRPKRIEHVNVLVPDVKGTREFLAKVLGLKMSDSAGDNMFSWHRAADGFHHTIALGPGPGKLHHYAFDLRSLEDLSGIADTLAARNRALIWGPGRHGAGANVFTYYIDPDGCIVENSIEMSRIDNDAVYEPSHWEIGEGLSGRWINMWGSMPPPNFGDPGIMFDAGD